MAIKSFSKNEGLFLEITDLPIFFESLILATPFFRKLIKGRNWKMK